LYTNNTHTNNIIRAISTQQTTELTSRFQINIIIIFYFDTKHRTEIIKERCLRVSYKFFPLQTTSMSHVHICTFLFPVLMRKFHPRAEKRELHLNDAIQTAALCIACIAHSQSIFAAAAVCVSFFLFLQPPSPFCARHAVLSD
jgi:hypothetical protein